MESKNKEFVDVEKESVNKTLSGEKKKLAQMTFGEKVEYIFDYYKLHILAVIVVLIIGGSLIHRQVTYQEPVLTGIVINSYNCSDTAESEIDDSLRQAGVLAKRECAVIYADAKSEINLSAGEYFNKLDIYAAAQGVDYMLGDEAAVEYVCDHLGIANSIRDYMPAELQELWAERFVVINQIDASDSSEFPPKLAVEGALDISGTKVQEFFGTDEDVCYLMVADMSGNTEKIEALFAMLYEIEKGN